jgi:hypothetical protein
MPTVKKAAETRAVAPAKGKMDGAPPAAAKKTARPKAKAKGK